MSNILFLPSWYPNKIYPQNGDFIQRHAMAVSLHNKVAVLYVLSDPETDQFDIKTNYHKEVFEVRVYYPKTNRFFPLRKLNRYMKAHRLGYEAILKEFKTIDLVHLNVFYKAGLFALELKKKFNIPYIITEHWTAFLDSNPTQFTPFEKISIRRIGKEAAMICPVSHDLEKAIKKMGVENQFTIVPNVVDTDTFKVGQRKTNSSSIKILHISTLYDPHKNVSGLINVIDKLKKQRSDFSLTIVGNHHVEQHQQTIDDRNLNDVISISGEIPHTKVAEVMNEHDFFVLFSNYENLPCVIIEAHASGLPVLSTDVGGISEMINKENGILIPAKEENLLLEKLNFMLDNIGNYNREKISQGAIERFSYESVSLQFDQIYKNVLQQNTTNS